MYVKTDLSCVSKHIGNVNVVKVCHLCSQYCDCLTNIIDAMVTIATCIVMTLHP